MKIVTSQDYIIRRLQQENDQIAEDERLVKQYRDETEKMRIQMEEMKTRSALLVGWLSFQFTV